MRGRLHAQGFTDFARYKIYVIAPRPKPYTKARRSLSFSDWLLEPDVSFCPIHVPLVEAATIIFTAA